MSASQSTPARVRGASAGVVHLAEWREADTAQRRELAARKFDPCLYRPLESGDLHSEIARIDTSVHTLYRGLKRGSLPTETAAAILALLHEDLETVLGAALTMERRLAKAKRKVKRGR